MKYKEIETDEALLELLHNEEFIVSYAFQHLDFEKVEHLAIEKTFSDCIFLGCHIPGSVYPLLEKDCLEFPMIDVPFNPFVNALYSRNTLFAGYELGKPESFENTPDQIIYRHYLKFGRETTDIKETLARRLHDHAVTDALVDFLAGYDEKKVVAVMGGHNLQRNDPGYLEVVKISKKLTELGYLMISGGGPGAMEATHVGAWFAGKPEQEILNAVSVLAEAPGYKHKLWLDKAFEVLSRFPETEYKSLGVPTWLYGHEPPTPFATHIAKYFANSVREDGLVTIAKGGIIFTPGSAGTVQEIFQDATQNHYLTFGYASPMVFFNRIYWTKEIPVYSMLQELMSRGKYNNLILSAYDSPAEVVQEIERFN